MTYDSIFYFCTVALAYPYAYFGLGTGPVALTNVNCDGSENNLLDCRYISFPDFYNHNDDAGVKCFNQSGTIYNNFSFNRQLVVQFFQDCRYFVVDMLYHSLIVSSTKIYYHIINY